METQTQTDKVKITTTTHVKNIVVGAGPEIKGVSGQRWFIYTVQPRAMAFPRMAITVEQREALVQQIKNLEAQTEEERQYLFENHCVGVIFEEEGPNSYPDRDTQSCIWYRNTSALGGTALVTNDDGTLEYKHVGAWEMDPDMNAYHDFDDAYEHFLEATGTIEYVPEAETEPEIEFVT